MGKASKVAMAAGIAAALVTGDHVVNNRYEFTLVRVIDSDTYRGVIELWPGLTKAIDIRVDGIDTPEKYRPSKKCPDHERDLAGKASHFAETALTDAARIYVTGIGLGKYAGRVVGSVFVIDERGREASMARMLMNIGLAYEYHGATKPPDYWCNVRARA